MVIGISEILAAVVGALATGIVGGVGVLVHRRITRASDRERIDELSQLANVASVMRGSDLSWNDLERIRKYAMVSIPREVELNTSAAATIVRDADLPWEEDGSKTQSEMTASAWDALEDAETKLANVLQEIANYLSVEEADGLALAQRKWESFKFAHANFVSSLVEQGSMAPLWRIMAMDTATRDRVRELEAHLQARKL